MFDAAPRRYPWRFGRGPEPVEPGVDQIPGSSSDWNTVQNFASIKNENSQIVFGSDGMPLVQLGDINLGKFQYISKVDKPHIYSWPMNNYWVTNFRDSQEGDLSWSYYITSTDDHSNSYATQFGWGSRVPLLARVLPSGKIRKAKSEQSFLNQLAPNLLLVSVRPSKEVEGVTLHLRELEGEKTTIDVRKILRNISLKKISEVNVLGEEISELTSELTFKPYEIKFLQIEI